MSYSASSNSIESLASPFASGSISSGNSGIYCDLVSKEWLTYNNSNNAIESSSNLLSFACLTSIETDNTALGSFYTTDNDGYLRGSLATGQSSNDTNNGTRGRSDDVSICFGTSHKTQLHSALVFSGNMNKDRTVTYYLRFK
tara:strand:- start:5058 stop:5483 length:426 start_codon:yes stop_codon:yes gene_type:complete